MKGKKIIIKTMDFIISDCNWATQKISKGLDENLNFKEKIKLKTHLLYCKYCRKFEIQSKKIDSQLKMTPEKLEKLNYKLPKLPSESKEKIKKKIKQYEYIKGTKKKY